MFSDFITWLHACHNFSVGGYSNLTGAAKGSRLTIYTLVVSSVCPVASFPSHEGGKTAWYNLFIHARGSQEKLGIRIHVDI